LLTAAAREVWEMAKKTIKMKPRKTRSKIKSIHVGPVWTTITLRIKTKQLNKQTQRAL
jgi:hypothetical protein